MSRKYTNDEFITRSYESEFETVDNESGLIIGMPIVFNQKTRVIDSDGEFDEIILPEALTNTNLKDVRLFINHDAEKIALARSKNDNANSTMKISIDENGVHIKAKLDIENNADARAVYSAIKRHDVDAMSFGFRVSGQKWENVENAIPTRTITEISIIHEVSIVNYPAYPQTCVSVRGGVKFSPLKEIRGQAQESAKLKLEKLRNQNEMI